MSTHAQSGNEDARSGFLAAWARVVGPRGVPTLATRRGRKPRVPLAQVLPALTFHVMQDAGTLAAHLFQLFRTSLADSSWSDRRLRLPWEIFAELMGRALRPRATPRQHREAFWRGWRLVGLDGTQKKIRFVSEAVQALDIRNVTAMPARAENLPHGTSASAYYDVVVARAVATLAELVHNAGRLLAPHGRLLAMKGRLPDEELRGVPRHWRADVVRLEVPGLDAERHLVSLTRVSKGAAAPGKGKPPTA